jgi:hypothetical protein
VPWEHCHRVIQGKQFLPDATKEEILVTSRKVPPADAFPEEHVSADDGLLFQKVKAQAPRTMARHMIDTHGGAEQLDRAILLEKEIGCERFDLQSESPIAKKFGIADHGSRGGVEGDFATVALDYRCSIDDMIEVSMGKQKQVNLFLSKSGICTLRSIEKDSALGRLVIKAVRIEHPAGEAFEPIHEKIVREMMSRFDFRESVCKLLTFSI